MPEEGSYLLTHVGFTYNGEPTLSLEQNGMVRQFNPIGHTLSIAVDAANQRYCTGWHDLRSSTDYSCPDSAKTESKYDQCAACQQRTGFNPAFYNASSVSTQQEELNQEPHILYLAHFGAGITKVGISRAKRNHARLLEQGARSALILETLPTALIARQYEARIAALPGIAETLQLQKKIKALRQQYDQTASHEELIEIKARIESMLKTTFNNATPLSFHNIYFPASSHDITSSIDTSEYTALSGRIIGMLGPFLFSTYQDSVLFLPLKKYTGYSVTITRTPLDIPIPSQQLSFF